LRIRHHGQLRRHSRRLNGGIIRTIQSYHSSQNYNNCQILTSGALVNAYPSDVDLPFRRNLCQ
jgi:hypothetical protein